MAQGPVQSQEWGGGRQKDPDLKLNYGGKDGSTENSDQATIKQIKLRSKMAGNWGKKTGNFVGRSSSSGRFVSAPSKPNADAQPKAELSRNMVERVSNALRSANEKTGFVRSDAKK
ncbi:MAG: hypothetical protein KJ947_15800 [Alphaproteobacteria bacterium]|nr:hypothetical protein [Alphaproteobacteria bacterium]MBU1551024.1 hypothetical protein [Alphaproteobacteria bacterium]MBU2339160.1 hypothetical protein [Alphaproteobacteria bacterium]MBU2387251.1 hypothetical protein [Alphaproteobacteria bacterium]